jgi:hypothetical protein
MILLLLLLEDVQIRETDLVMLMQNQIFLLLQNLFFLQNQLFLLLHNKAASDAQLE